MTTTGSGGRRGLQITLGALAVIPAASGLAGMMQGADVLPGGRAALTPSVDSEYRYAHAIWFAVAPVIWSSLPRIEENGRVLRAVSSAVVLGGLARAWSWRRVGRPHAVFVGATALELVGIPAVAAWQTHVARVAGRSRAGTTAPAE
jgi:hypothetical protein